MEDEKLVPYVRYMDEYGYSPYERVYPTGKCQRVTKLGKTTEWAEVSYTIFGFRIPFLKYWVRKSDIEWYPPEKIENYQCPNLGS